MFGMAFKMTDDRTNFSRVCHHGPAGCRADDGKRGSSGSTHRLSAVVIMKLPYVPPPSQACQKLDSAGAPAGAEALDGMHDTVGSTSASFAKPQYVATSRRLRAHCILKIQNSDWSPMYLAATRAFARATRLSNSPGSSPTLNLHPSRPVERILPTHFERTTPFRAPPPAR